MKPSSLQLFLLVSNQQAAAKKTIHFEWKELDAEPGNEILAYRVFRSRRSNGYKAVQIGMTLSNSYTDYEPRDGQNYYGIVPVTRKEELPWIDIPLTPEQIQIEERHEKLFKAIDKILWYDWDPLKIKQTGNGETDRYLNYAGMIWWLATDGIDTETIARELSGIDRGFMNGKGDMDVCRRVAGKIARLSC